MRVDYKEHLTLRILHLKERESFANTWHSKLLKCSNNNICFLQIIETGVEKSIVKSIQLENYILQNYFVRFSQIYHRNLSTQIFSNVKLISIRTRYKDYTANQAKNIPCYACVDVKIFTEIASSASIFVKFILIAIFQCSVTTIYCFKNSSF